MKQAKKTSFKMLPSTCSWGLLCVCAIFRINHLAKILYSLASRMRLRVFLQFFFSNIVSACFNYLIHVVSFVQETLEKRLSSCQNVWFCYCTEINIVTYVLYTKQRICGRWAVPGVGNCLFLRARGLGIDRQVRTKLQIPGGMTGGDGYK